MIFDAEKDTTPGQSLTADICIVGSGAAGIAMAHKFIGSHKKVIVLESSRVSERQYFDKARLTAFQTNEFPTLRGDQPHRFEDPTVQPLYAGVFSGPEDGNDFLKLSRVRVYGGTTNCWGGWTRPLTDADFDRSNVAADFRWPLTARDLRPWYDEAIRTYCSLGDWPVHSYDDPHFWVGKTVAGQEIAPIELSVGSPLQSAVILQINSNTGAEQDGRLDFQLVWGPFIEKAENVLLYRNANARFLESSSKSSPVTRVKATTVNDVKKAGHDFFVKADQYVLATGCIETMRLLSVSNSLGNECAYYGTNLFTHPLSANAAKFTVATPPSDAIRRFYGGTATVNVGSYPPWLLGALVPTAKTLSEKKIGNFRAQIGFDKGQDRGTVNFNWEQFPDFSNGVTLDSTKDGIFGDPRVRVALQLTDRDKRTLTEGLTLIGQTLEAIGYAKPGSFKPTNETVYLPGAHAMGVTRMSAENLKGVVNPDCRMWFVNNLYIAGGSVFPTGGWANPTLTILALALRLAKHLGA
jgi:choline dehydrogenase-like flavoprotein